MKDEEAPELLDGPDSKTDVLNQQAHGSSHLHPRYSLRVSVFHELSINFIQNYTQMHIFLPD